MGLKMAHDVFISYSTKDQKIVEGLSAYLEQNGIRCFIAYRDIPRGVTWAKAITEAIENCKLMIVVFSEHFNRSEQVDREVEMCIEEGKPILTFKIEDTAFTGAKKFYLKNINWIDAFPNPKEYFGELLASIGNFFPELTGSIHEPPPLSTKKWLLIGSIVAAIVLLLTFGILNYYTQQQGELQHIAYIEKEKQEQQQEEFTKKLNIEMIFVEGGTFSMGAHDSCPDCDLNERFLHQVTVSDFYIGKYPVTVGQFRVFVDATDYNTQADALIKENSTWVSKSDANWKNPYFSQTNECPVACVSWNDANAFCEWLKKQTGKNYRLPTEAEWEYVAIGGLVGTCNSASKNKYAGSNNPNEVAWYKENSNQTTHPVGTKNPNELGIYDMSGNVWEWCSDWFGEYSSSVEKNPKGTQLGTRRVLRGGGWGTPAQRCRTTFRNRNTPDSRDSDIGFRLSLEIDTK